MVMTKTVKTGKPMSTAMFQALVTELESPLGCNFRTNPDTQELEWECDGELTYTEKWLRKHQLSIKANKHLLRELGGHCDCEVVLNAVRNWEGYDDAFMEGYNLGLASAMDAVPSRTHRRKKR
jgi:hypothetical protein